MSGKSNRIFHKPKQTGLSVGFFGDDFGYQTGGGEVEIDVAHGDSGGRFPYLTGGFLLEIEAAF